MTFKKTSFRHTRQGKLFYLVCTLILMQTTSSAQPVQEEAHYRIQLSSWYVAAQSSIGADSMALMEPGYQVEGWVPAEVPGTVFGACVAAGNEKDPNFGDNIYRVDKSKYDQNFWYRTVFEVPTDYTKDKIWLNFKGINNRGDIYLNNHFLGTLNGIMQRKRYDITTLVNRKGKNVLAVLVYLPKQPMANYASPTYIPSGGWDWMPYVPGLNMGITSSVYLSNSGAVSIADPWIRSDLPTNARADLTVNLMLHNASETYQQAEVIGRIMPGNIRFRQKVGVESHRDVSLNLDKVRFPQLSVNRPKLWWPNGYGKPNLYTCTFEVKLGDHVSDRKKVVFGIRKYSYDTTGGVLHIAINGVRVFIKGGNWGMPEYMLRCRGQEYYTKVKLHREMNFNMIRNWLGSTTDDEFYDACDKYGIMVWDDFWLNANPNLPADIQVFNQNAIEKIKRMRNHPSIAIWCGDNEGWPVAPLNEWLREDIKTFDRGDRYYQPNSHAEHLSGSGLWGNHDPRWYFSPYPESMGGTPGWGLRTEIGTAVFPNFESFKKFMPEDKWWPRNEMWNQHFFGQKAFNATPDYYDQSLRERYGQPKGIKDYCRKAQLMNIETNKAMFEGWEDHMWEDASGIMTWMSQAAYPSMVWQTYDYYYDLTGAYWGAKSACEPLHIQWNPVTNAVKVINTTRRNADSLQVSVAVYNLNGQEVKKYRENAVINSYPGTATQCFVIPFEAAQHDLAAGKPVFSSSNEHGKASDVTDSNPDTRWASNVGDNQWIYVDLTKNQDVNRVVLDWQEAFGRRLKIQVSQDAKEWKDVANVENNKPGTQSIYFDDVTARYVRMLGLKRATGWGYSLWSFQVFGSNSDIADLSPVHFLKLQLKNRSGEIISNNFYWRGTNRKDFTALNTLPSVKLKSSFKIMERNGRTFINALVTNPNNTPAVAFAVRVEAINNKTGQQILPAFMSSNYFSLLKGESKEVRIDFDSDLLKNGENVKLRITPYNN